MKLGALSFQVALSCALHTQLGWNVVCFRHVQKISLSLRFSRPSSPPLSFFNLVAQLVGEGLDALLPLRTAVLNGSYDSFWEQRSHVLV